MVSDLAAVSSIEICASILICSSSASERGPSGPLSLSARARRALAADPPATEDAAAAPPAGEATLALLALLNAAGDIISMLPALLRGEAAVLFEEGRALDADAGAGSSM